MVYETPSLAVSQLIAQVLLFLKCATTSYSTANSAVATVIFSSDRRYDLWALVRRNLPLNAVSFSGRLHWQEVSVQWHARNGEARL